MKVRKYFQERLSNHSELHKQFQQKTRNVAGIRVLVFLMALVAFLYFINERQLGVALGLLAVALIVFIFLIKWHNRLKFKRDQHGFLVEINIRELARLDGNMSEIADGEEFRLADHAYADDLDILGKHSVYQLLNRTSTYPGKKLLSSRLLGSNRVADLPAYQKGMTNLAQLPDFMQKYQALGMQVKATANDFEQLTTWLTAPSVLSGKRMLFWSWVLRSLFVAGFILVTVLDVTYYSLLPLVIVNMILLGQHHKYAVKVVEQTTRSLEMLRSFVHHITLVEDTRFKSDHLISLQKAFMVDGHSARIEIDKIAGYLEQLQARNNLIHIFVNLPLLLDLHWLLKIETWQKLHREHAEAWFNTLAEFEVLNSLAGQAFANPDWSVPVPVTSPYYLSAEDLGHPLLIAEKRVNNNFGMEGEGTVILLTGPNMAGKSTFLRTVGVNIVLARMGGSVCAKAFSFNPEMQVFTAMRIKDDLSESVSSFYAELSRIKQLLEMAQAGVPVLYFLDEILKGTNSADRHKGAEALIKQLSGLKVAGFVSTHDLELGALAGQLPKVRNYSFESIITDDRITFDYKLREGICQSFNACELMRQMGIEV